MEQLEGAQEPGWGPSQAPPSLPGLLHPFPDCSIPSLLCLCCCCPSLARLGSVPERDAGATAQPRGCASVQPMSSPAAVPMSSSGAVPMPMLWLHRDTLGCAHSVSLGLHSLPAPARASLIPQPSRVTLPATAQPHAEPGQWDRDSRARGREKPFLFFSTAVKKEKAPGLTQIDPGAAPSAGDCSPKLGPLAAQVPWQGWEQHPASPCACCVLTASGFSPTHHPPLSLLASHLFGGPPLSHTQPKAALQLQGLPCPSSRAGSAPQDPKTGAVTAQAGTQTLLKAEWGCATALSGSRRAQRFFVLQLGPASGIQRQRLSLDQAIDAVFRSK